MKKLSKIKHKNVNNVSKNNKTNEIMENSQRWKLNKKQKDERKVEIHFEHKKNYETMLKIYLKRKQVTNQNEERQENKRFRNVRYKEQNHSILSQIYK